MKCWHNIYVHFNCLPNFLPVPPTTTPFSCNSFTEAWEPCLDKNSRTGEPMLQESITEFSMKLYSYFRESQPSSNLLFSPISISGILSHLLLGMNHLNNLFLSIVKAWSCSM